MVAISCAACDCRLDVNRIKVKIGGKTVEVCCDECAQKLKEARFHGAVEDGMSGERTQSGYGRS